MSEPKVYRVVRYYRDPEKPSKKIKGGLTLTEAREYCSRPTAIGDMQCPQHGRVRHAETYCPSCGIELIAGWFYGFTTNE